MNKILLIWLILVAFIATSDSYAMKKSQPKTENSRHSDEDNIITKRRKLDDSHESGESQAKKLIFFAHQDKVRYFLDFRSHMERKFSYWGSALGKILDKLGALYLDKASDKPGVFVVGSMPGVGKNTFVKHIRDFLERDPFRDSNARGTRFQLIKDKNKKIFDNDILLNTGSRERLRKGINNVVVIDEIQSMVKDYSVNNLANELWFHAFGDAEVNIDIATYINTKRVNICSAVKKNHNDKTQLNYFASEIIRLKKKIEDAKDQDPNSIPAALTNSLRDILDKKQQVEDTINYHLNYLTMELGELMSEVPDFFCFDEQNKNPEIIARAFLDSDSGLIERRFINAPNYKHVYFDRNIYIFLGNPAKINDTILEEFDRATDKSRDALRALAKEKLSEQAVRAWFTSHALHSQYYALNKRGWDSRMPDVFAIYPPASKHLPALIGASIESDFCSESHGSICIDNAALSFFSAELSDATKDLRALAGCYSPILTKMFTELELRLSPDHEPKFLLEKSDNKLVLMLDGHSDLKAIHIIKNKKQKKNATQVINPTPTAPDEADQEKYALYSAYYYAFYQYLFPRLPDELYRIDDAKFNDFYEEQRLDFNLSQELSILALNFVIKFVGMTTFCGKIDQVFKKEQAMASIIAIVKYIAALKITHSNQDIYFIIKTALCKINNNFGQFFGASGIFEYIDTVLMNIPGKMDIDGVQNTNPSHEKIAEHIYDILICFDDGQQSINKIIDSLSNSPLFQLLIAGYRNEFLKGKKLIVTFDNLQNSTNVALAGNL